MAFSNKSYTESIRKNCTRTLTVIMTHRESGFASELNLALFAVLYAAETNRTFHFDGHFWLYGNWSDFFDSPSDCELPTNVTAATMLGNRTADERQPHLFTGRYVDWSRLLQHKQPADIFLVKAKALRTIWHVTMEIRDLVLQQMRNLSLLANDSEACTRLHEEGGPCDLENVKTVLFIGAHVRRGDKHLEAHEQSIEKYVAALDQLGCDLLLLTEANNSSLRRRCSRRATRAENSWSDFEFPFPVFINTDDMQKVIPQIRLIRPRWNLIYSTPPVVLKGFDALHFDELPLAVRKLHTIDLIINLELLRRANRVVCTHSSNIARLLALLRDPRWPLDSMRSLDVGWHPGK